jgi:hypothetical protein
VFATENFHALLQQFQLEEDCVELSPPMELTEGHINSTYLLEAKGLVNSKRRYILQKINTYVFPRPAQLMENIVGVTAYIRKKIAVGQGLGQQTLTVYPTRSGAWYHTDAQGNCWRCYNYIENTYSLQVVGPMEAFRVAKAFGAFQKLLDGYPIARLHETIPEFHNTVKRYEALEEAIVKNAAGRRDAVAKEIAFACARKADASRLTELLAAGRLPLRVTHNDTKLNNVLFDNRSHEAVCVVDLDTIMPGLLLYDYGDSLRFLGNTAAEDERDLRKVDFSMDLFQAYTKGYLEACADTLTTEERKWMPFSIKLMTFECGMRFLADYLNGDVYFRIRRPDDNLARCRTQFRLVERIEALLPEMTSFLF